MKRIPAGLTVFLLIITVGVSNAWATQPSLNDSIKEIFSYRTSHKVPGFRPTEKIIYKSATPIMLNAKKHPELLSDDNKFILNRPTDPGDPDYYGAGITVLSYGTTHFLIHYTENNTYGDAVYGSDGNPATIPQFVKDAGDAFEYSYGHIITDLGFSAPAGDGSLGGDSRIDVYILNINAYGYTTYDTSPSQAYIIIDNDFSTVPSNLDPAGTRAGAIKVTAAHELFHVFQLQLTDDQSNVWWMETSSTWMEDEVYPYVNDYLNYIGLRYDDTNDNGMWDSGETFYNIDGSVAGNAGRPVRWFDEPDTPLDTDSDSDPLDYFKYGDVIWAKYLTEKHGLPVMHDIWVRIGSGRLAVQAIPDEISSLGTTLSADLRGLRSAVFERDFVDGTYYPLVKHAGVFSSYPQTVTGTLDHLSSRYYAFEAGADASDLYITFTNMNISGLSARIVLVKNGGGFDIVDPVLNSGSIVSKVSGFGLSSTYLKAVVIVCNVSTSTNALSYSVSASFTPGQSSGGGGGGGGGGCFIATAAYGSYLAPEVMTLRRFRDEWLMTNKAGRLFVDAYYRLSPPVAEFILEHEAMRFMARTALTPVVYGIKYPGMSLFIIIFTPLGVFGYLKKRRLKINKRMPRR